MKKKVYIPIFLLVLFIIIISLVYEIKKLNYSMYNKRNIEIIKTKTFKSELLENLIDEFEFKAKENNVGITSFSLVKYDNQTYFKVDIPEIENSSYIVHYEGIDVTSLYANIGHVRNEDISIIEKIIITLVEVSDKTISKEEALRIFALLSKNLGDKNFANVINYKNGLTYNLEISKTGGLIFYAK